MNSIVILTTFVVLACGSLAAAWPGSPRVAGVDEIAIDALHACLLIVEREDLKEDEKVAFGGGSIVSRTRILTAAHVVRGATSVQAGFYSGRISAGRLRRVDSVYVQPIQSFDAESFESDLAIVVFAANAFPMANVIRFSATAPTGAASLAGYGYRKPNAAAANEFPILAAHTIGDCPEKVKVPESHFCAKTTAPAVVCPGDNGSGLYTGAAAARRLVGVASIFPTTCVVDAESAVGFSKLSEANVVAFLLSQGVEAAAAAADDS